MNLDTFFEKFEQLADAPDAVPQFKGLILDLAVRGQLITKGNDWEAEKLESLTTKIGSGATPKGGRESYQEDGIPLIRSMNVYYDGFVHNGLVYLDTNQAAKLKNVIVEAGDVLLNITGASIGRVTIAPDDMAGARVNQHVTIIRPTSNLLSRFLAIFLASPGSQLMIDDIQVGATRQALTKGMIQNFIIPLPSISEQKRIVAKVDGLMALCDRLEAQQQERDTQHAALARASLARFADAPTPANLDFLFHKSYTITPADLRKSILTLAVQGKLVPQDPNDEPVTQLLGRISDEKMRLVEAGVIKKHTAKAQATLPKDLDLPSGWERVQLLDCCNYITDGDHLPPPKTETGVPFLVIGNVRWGSINFEGCRHVSAEYFEKLDPIRKPERGDILYTLVGSFGIPIIVDVDRAFCVQRHIGIIRPSSEMSLEYVALVLGSDPVLVQASTIATGIAQKTVPLSGLRKVEVPLPPVAEQRRIVVKVDQLMTLVDELETQIADSESTAKNLLEALVAELTTPQEAVCIS